MGGVTRFMGVYEIYGRVYEIYGSLRDLWELRDLWGVQLLPLPIINKSFISLLTRACQQLHSGGPEAVLLKHDPPRSIFGGNARASTRFSSEETRPTLLYFRWMSSCVWMNWWWRDATRLQNLDEWARASDWVSRWKTQTYIFVSERVNLSELVVERRDNFTIFLMNVPDNPCFFGEPCVVSYQ